MSVRGASPGHDHMDGSMLQAPRDRKLAKRRTQDRMRGRRSVFEIQKAILKRSRKER